MRAIAEPFYDGSPILLGAVFGLVLFVTLFSLVLARVLRASAATFDGTAALALRDDVATVSIRTSKSKEPT